MTVVQLPEELVALRDAIRTFIQREIAPKEATYAQEITETGTFAALEQEKKALRKRSAAEGYYSLFMPEEAGGGGVGYLGLVLCVEECMRHGLLLAMPGGVLPSVEGPTPILLDGTPEQQERYLQPTMRAERDPIEQVKNRILEKRYGTEESLKTIETEVRAIVTEAADFATADAEPPPSELWTDIYAPA